MKKFLTFFPLFVLILLTSCNPVSTPVWTYTLVDRETTVGVELGDGEVYFADNTGTVISVSETTGLVKWEKTQHGWDVAALAYTGRDDLYAVYTNAATNAKVIVYDELDGTQNGEFSLGTFSVMMDSLVYTNASGDEKVLLHSEDSLLEIDVDSRTFDVNSDAASDLSTGEVITMMIYVPQSSIQKLFVISSKMQVISFDDPANGNASVEYRGIAHDFYGSATYNASTGDIYLGSEDGVFVFNVEDGWQLSASPMIDEPVGFGQMAIDRIHGDLYVPLGGSTSSHYGLGSFAYNDDFDENWQYNNTSGSVSKSSAIYSNLYGLTGFLDDNGRFYVIDRSGNKIHDYRIGSVTNSTPPMTAYNESRENIYILTQAPPRLTCYHLLYAAGLAQSTN